MKFRDLVEGAKKIGVGVEGWDLTHLHQELGAEDWVQYKVDLSDSFPDFTMATLHEWLCTDTMVGVYMYFWKGEFLAATSQDGRKGPIKVTFASREIALRFKDYMDSLLVEEEDEIEVFSDYEVEMGAGFRVYGEWQVKPTQDVLFDGVLMKAGDLPEDAFSVQYDLLPEDPADRYIHKVIVPWPVSDLDVEKADFKRKLKDIQHSINKMNLERGLFGSKYRVDPSSVDYDLYVVETNRLANEARKFLKGATFKDSDDPRVQFLVALDVPNRIDWTVVPPDMW